MEHLEKVEKLSQKADVSYEEAKKALEECEWDMLDALVMLEEQGKIKSSAASSQYNSDSTGQWDETAQQPPMVFPGNGRGSGENGEESEHAKQQNRFFAKVANAIKYLVRKGCENSLIVKRHGQPLMDLPVIAFVILLILFFWVVVPLMVVSLFFDFSYNFKGSELGKEKINETMEQATEAVNHFKSEINKGGKQ